MARSMRKKPHYEKRDARRPPRPAPPSEKTFGTRVPEARRERAVDKRERTDVIFGLLPVTEALRANARRIDRIAVAEGSREKRLDEIYDLARAGGVRVDRVSRDAIDKLVLPGSN